ncbi:MAG: hypothetical protein HY318_05660 [Armatimonadetes bacterium]|nr:hypothetical protein [Armatimonadota bacterium]
MQGQQQPQLLLGGCQFSPLGSKREFFRDLGTSPAESSSRNPLEQPWTLTPEEFTKRAHKHGTPNLRLFTTVRDETAALTEEIAKVGREMRTHRVRDERVAGLYGVTPGLSLG